MPLHPFHHAFAVHDLAAARQFYGELLGCSEGRSSDEWIDFDLYGHQIVAHLVPTMKVGPVGTNDVDHQHVPVPHFGVVLDWQSWHALADHLRAQAVRFVIEPQIRFRGKAGEQATMFFLDPSGNALEFKAMRHAENLFKKQDPEAPAGC